MSFIIDLNKIVEQKMDSKCVYAYFVCFEMYSPHASGQAT